MKLNPYLTLYTKIYSKWIKALNMRLETVKLLEENTGEQLCNIGFGSDFLDTNKSTGNKSKSRQVGLYPTKKFCTAKEMINRVKGILWNEKKNNRIPFI